MNSPSPIISTTARWRGRWVTCLLLCCWGLLAARLLHIQWWQREEFGSVATRQQVSSDIIRARPGDIRDRRGRLLATTIVVPSFYVDPHALSNRAEFSQQVAPLLGLQVNELTARLEQHQQRRFLWIKRRLSSAEHTAIRQLNLPSHLCGMRSEFQRHYPQGVLAAHVLGLRDLDGTGRGGVEQTFDDMLRGRDGTRRFVRDAQGYVLEVLEEVTEPPLDGAEVTLTLDMVLQLHLEQRLDHVMQEFTPLGVCGIVLDPQRGEVLAMASRPTFNPNQPHLATEAGWKNLCLAAVYEPGSTFKPLVVSRALDLGTIQPTELLNCEHGAYRMGPRILHDHHPYGLLSVSDVLVKSSNIGMAKIGEGLGNEELHRLALDFGFGQRTGIELPGELTGMLRPLERWNHYSTGSIPMGQELSATPLQIIAAHAALANRGRRITPHVLMATNDRQPTAQQVVVSQVVTTETARWLVTGPLVDVVERGTGTKARLPGIQVFGKTGTAQKVDAQTGKYSSTRHVSSFVCGAPAENPQVLVLVTIDEPTGNQYGGIVAAPVAADILRATLRYLQPSTYNSPATVSRSPTEAH